MNLSRHLARGVIAVLAAGTLTMIGVSVAGGSPAVHRQATSTVDQPEANDTPDRADLPEANDTQDTADTPEANDTPDTPGMNDQREQSAVQDKPDAGGTHDPQD
jgi:hypothetical protein